MPLDPQDLLVQPDLLAQGRRSPDPLDQPALLDQQELLEPVQPLQDRLDPLDPLDQQVQMEQLVLMEKLDRRGQQDQQDHRGDPQDLQARLDQRVVVLGEYL